ncbi:MAG: response regulator, partial [candidate division Zixibacteria bacterium]|nr:response regulator [candidate division Zixibacteria bacterium]
DELDARDRIKQCLARRMECTIQEAGDGRQALELIDKEPFDLILLDIKMQGISGIDVLKKTKASHPHTDIIMITAYDSQQVARETLKEGATEYIIKPSTMDVIRSKVQHILEKRKQYLPKSSKV